MREQGEDTASAASTNVLCYVSPDRVAAHKMMRSFS